MLRQRTVGVPECQRDELPGVTFDDSQRLSKSADGGTLNAPSTHRTEAEFTGVGSQNVSSGVGVEEDRASGSTVVEAIENVPVVFDLRQDREPQFTLGFYTLEAEFLVEVILVIVSAVLTLLVEHAIYTNIPGTKSIRGRSKVAAVPSGDTGSPGGVCEDAVQVVGTDLGHSSRSEDE